MADQATIAIENARPYEQARQLAMVEKRQRLARELHDSVTQALYGTTLYAKAASRQLATGQAELTGEHLRELRDTAQEALREPRLLIFELRHFVLEDEGLVDALRGRLEAVEQRPGLELAFHADDEMVLPASVEEGLYRIAQEALDNGLRHACAQRVSVSLEMSEEAVVLEVLDDKCGFDPATAIPAGGVGWMASSIGPPRPGEGWCWTGHLRDDEAIFNRPELEGFLGGNAFRFLGLLPLGTSSSDGWTKNHE